MGPIGSRDLCYHATSGTPDKRCMLVAGTTADCLYAMQVILDPLTNRSKGYGFVRFGSETERDSALSTMNGLQVGCRF